MESSVIGKVFGTVNETGNNFLHEICQAGSSSLLRHAGIWLGQTNKLLVQNYNHEGYQCIHIVARVHRGQVAVQLIEVLLDLGADLNAHDRTSGSTALHIAVINHDYHLLTWICHQACAELEAVNYAGLTAYQIAWKVHDTKMMDIFWDFGADCDLSYSDDNEYSDDDDDDDDS